MWHGGLRGVADMNSVQNKSLKQIQEHGSRLHTITSMQSAGSGHSM
jgi:hypothetical protein